MTDAQTEKELSRIRALFRVTRAAGLWASRYPQTEYSALLGVTVREQVEDSHPDLPLTVMIRTSRVQHASGHALPAAGYVWHGTSRKVPVA